MTNSSLARTPAASLITVLALVQAALGVLRALGFVQIGSDLVGHGVLLLPLGVIVFARAALIAGIALLYTFFAPGAHSRSVRGRAGSG